MAKSCIRILSVLLIMAGLTSCVKFLQPSQVCGTWQSVQEKWTIIKDGVKTNENFDFGGVPTKESTYFQLYKAGFDTFSTTETKSMTLVYSDRFSAIDPVSSERIKTQKSVTYKRGTITGSGNEVWKIESLEQGRMKLYYDSGVMEQDGVEVRKLCSFVFVK